MHVGLAMQKSHLPSLFLLNAIQTGDYDVVPYYLNQGADPNISDEAGFSALIIASEAGKIAIVKRLLAARANVDAHNILRETALIKASEKGHTLIVKMLLDTHANIDICALYGRTALAKASENGHTEVVRILLDAHANVDAHGKIGKTALIEASDNGHTEIVQMLLSARANVNANGGTALVRASENRDIEIVQILLDAHANVNALDSVLKETPLMCTASHTLTNSSSYQCAVALLKARADITLINILGQTALDLARENNNTDIIELFERYLEAIHDCTADEWQELPLDVLDAYIMPFLTPEQKVPEQEKSKQ